MILTQNVIANSKKEYTLKGIYLDSEKGNTIEGVKVCIKNIKSGAKTTIYTDQNGQFVLTLEGEANYKIYGTKDLYFDQEEHTISTEGDLESNIIEVSFNIKEVKCDIPYTLSDLHFEVNNSAILEDGEQHIDFLYELLSKNHKINVIIRVHSDARGANDYNKEITQSRADYLKEILVSKNISSTRITAEGVGEEEIVNDCIDGIRCSGERHLENRRVEIVLKQS
ncbi:OmpA family protein [Flammeovirga yaeyamensis]|uniref:OmpA family protein n=1 Tax=Flammeovirga yaeyamensis TaxID=367791 RepID=A0AAX1N669_9BACT|nr:MULTISPECIES: OmpA family protein [Flammeovirga]ANQ49786.2 OmpA family protein [Flammeovirga sp. MY04]MBB3697352.1 outer membrane protein OmpA-like peptidoglycan-associated protein [Flammeovirga yaeyamensis]NMF36046.1 OmpA family protein [Flammeovirga yaeyamensis]QWG02781.1 OmpA family protein [Flammeovirga yaeyamensis]